MAKLKFTGPEGAPYAGATLRLVSLDSADIDLIDDLQRETGASMDDVIEWFDPQKKRAKGVAAIFYFTLRTAGMFVSFKEAWGLVMGGEYEEVPEPGDKPTEKTADPQSAPTDPSRGYERAAPKAAPKDPGTRPKRTKTSAPRS